MSSFQQNRSQSSHPLPPPPGNANGYPQQQALQRGGIQPRPRSKSSFSFRSDKSHKSQGSEGKIDLHESSQEKASRRLTSKADPLLAMNEAEPSAVAMGQATRLAPLRAIQHRDNLGNPIADPDRSNPTRSRWERPLDTIRAFEAAIDGNYSRKSYMRPEPNASAATPNGMNRRSSYFAGSNVSMNQPRGGRDSYYGGRPNLQQSESYYEGYNNGTGSNNGYNPNRARYPRTASEPMLHNGAGVYPTQGNQQSYETVTTASGSHSSGDPHGYQTGPSSENSSVHHQQVPLKPEPINDYGLGFETGQTPQLNSYGSNVYNGTYGQTPAIMEGYQNENGAPPPVPRKGTQGSQQRGPPIKLGPSANGGNQQPGYNNQARPVVGDKRKSWFSKRFSKA